VSELSLHDAIYTTRAMRRLGTEPVSEDDLRYIVEAATMAPSGGNAQRWAFVVITDPAAKRRIGDIYRDLGRKYVLARGLESGGLSERARRVYRNAMRLVEHLGEAPALILACVRERPPGDPAAATAYYGSIFPAIQNLMLAARSRGLGTTLTTLHKLREDDVRQLLAIPDEVETIALIPVGRPRGTWGFPRRRPSSEVTHWNRWGERRPTSA
jgi:nitroreductase